MNAYDLSIKSLPAGWNLVEYDTFTTYETEEAARAAYSEAEKTITKSAMSGEIFVEDGDLLIVYVAERIDAAHIEMMVEERHESRNVDYMLERN